MQNRVGQQFGNYRLLHLLGRGGFAEVYLGEHVHMQSKAAVKVLNGPLATSEAPRFLHEAQILVRLEHANIVGIKEFDIKQGIPFLVMHYAPNGALHQRHLRGQRVPLEVIIPYVQQVASALQYAHDRQVVHCDVKPENMLIDYNGTLLLSDFGIAVLSSSTHSSGSKGLLGTYLYMAPEQITGKALPASDQYALGIAVYEWLCGEAPFIGSAAEITAKHLNVVPPSFRERGIVVEPQVEMVIRRALEKDPRQRFASVREFALALQSSSNAQQHKSVQFPVPGRNDSILPSPSPKTAGFTYPYPAAPPPQAPPRLTPHITRSVGSSLSGIPSLPSSPLVPTIYPGDVRYAPTQPAPRSVQPRKTGSSCLAITVISVALLLLIVIGSVFALPQISQVVSVLLPPGATATPTQGATVVTPTPGATATPTPGATATPTQVPNLLPVDINEASTFADNFCIALNIAPSDAFNNKMSKKYADHHDERNFAASFGSCSGHNRPKILNNACTVVLHGGTTDYTATIIHDPGSNGELKADDIQ